MTDRRREPLPAGYRFGDAKWYDLGAIPYNPFGAMGINYAERYTDPAARAWWDAHDAALKARGIAYDTASDPGDEA